MTAQSLAPAADWPATLPDGHAEAMLESLSLLLASRRVLTYHRARTRKMDQRRLDAAWQRIEGLAETRDRWALRVKTDNPEFWITAYTRLIEQYTAARDRLRTEAEEMSSRARRLVFTEDLPALDRQIAVYRARLQHWRVAL